MHDNEPAIDTRGRRTIDSLPMQLHAPAEPGHHVDGASPITDGARPVSDGASSVTDRASLPLEEPVQSLMETVQSLTESVYPQMSQSNH